MSHIVLNIPHIESVTTITRDGLYVVGLSPREDRLQIVGVNRLLSDDQIALIVKAGARHIVTKELPRHDPSMPLLIEKSFMSYEFIIDDEFVDGYNVDMFSNDIKMGHVFQ
jgi:hypothetical protein